MRDTDFPEITPLEVDRVLIRARRYRAALVAAGAAWLAGRLRAAVRSLAARAGYGTRAAACRAGAADLDRARPAQ